MGGICYPLNPSPGVGGGERQAVRLDSVWLHPRLQCLRIGLVAWENGGRLQLDIKLRLETPRGCPVLNCLIDTGAQGCSIKRRLPQSSMVGRASQLIPLFTADGCATAGGDQVIVGWLHMQAVERGTHMDSRGSCAMCNRGTPTSFVSRCRLPCQYMAERYPLLWLVA